MSPWIGTAFLPLAAWIYSGLNSWHCALMCGALSVGRNPKERHTLFLFRMLSYTSMGFLMGYAGLALKNSLEFGLVRVFAFIAFVLLSLFFVLPQLVPGLPHWSLRGFLNLPGARTKSPALRGALMAFIPCHLLTFYYGLATLSSSPFVGAGLLFGHSVLTTPGLAYSLRAKLLLDRFPKGIRYGLRLALLAFVMFNLYHYASLLLMSEGAQVSPLLCL